MAKPTRPPGLTEFFSWLRFSKPRKEPRFDWGVALDDLADGDRVALIKTTALEREAAAGVLYRLSQQWPDEDVPAWVNRERQQALLGVSIKLMALKPILYRIFQNKLQVSYDNGAIWIDLYGPNDFDDFFIKRNPNGGENTITQPGNGAALNMQGSGTGSVLNIYPGENTAGLLVSRPGANGANPLVYYSKADQTSPYLTVLNRFTLGEHDPIDAHGDIKAQVYSGQFVATALPTPTLAKLGALAFLYDPTFGTQKLKFVKRVGSAFEWADLGEKGDPGVDGTDGTNGQDGTNIADGSGVTLAPGSQTTATLINHPTIPNAKRIVVGAARGFDGQNGTNGTNGSPGVLDLIINLIDAKMDQSGTLASQTMTLNLHRAIDAVNPPPESPGQDSACNLAEANVRLFQDFWTNLSNKIAAGAAASSIALDFVAIALSLGSASAGGVVAGLSSLIQNVITLTTALIDAELTNLNYERLRCILYCAMGTNAQFTTTEYSQMLTNLENSEIDEFAKFVFRGFFTAVCGVSGANSAYKLYGVADADCSACDCAEVVPGVYNFVGGARGWTALTQQNNYQNGYGGVLQPDGWHPTTNIYEGYGCVLVSPVKAWKFSKLEAFYADMPASGAGFLWFVRIQGGWVQKSGQEIFNSSSGIHTRIFDPEFECEQLMLYTTTYNHAPTNDYRIHKIVVTGTSP